ncbi:MAG: hypothetical protein WD768_03440 [Phycisphaeraceae bacterium]
MPKPEDLVDETISTWIEEDLAELGQETEKFWDGVGSLSAYRSGGQDDKLQVGMRKPPPPAEKSAGASTAATKGKAKAEPPKGADDQVKITPNDDNGNSAGMSTIMAAMDDAGAPSVGGKSEKSSAAAASAAATAVKPVATPIASDVGTSAGASGVSPARRSGTVNEETPYPNSLRVDPRAPHLVVVQCDQSGVRIAFDSIHLEDEGFRVSMPMCCTFSGMAERRKLYARPLAFIDRSSARLRSASEVDVKHTVLVGNQAPDDMLTVLGEISELPKPFNWPMPYYSGPDHSHISLRCWTETRPEGGYTCYVNLPHGPTALQWLAHVNGVCGLDYAKLEYDVGLLENEAWRGLGDECRRRLGIWCPFEPMEQFRTYISDGDFGTRDRGLAGLVFTDRRLLFCKYHHRGSVNLSEPGTMQIRDEGDFSNIAIENADGRTRLVKVRLFDVEPLLAALASWPNITVDRRTMEAPATST